MTNQLRNCSGSHVFGGCLLDLGAEDRVPRRTSNPFSRTSAWIVMTIKDIVSNRFPFRHISAFCDLKILETFLDFSENIFLTIYNFARVISSQLEFVDFHHDNHSLLY